MKMERTATQVEGSLRSFPSKCAYTLRTDDVTAWQWMLRHVSNKTRETHCVREELFSAAQGSVKVIHPTQMRLCCFMFLANFSLRDRDTHWAFLLHTSSDIKQYVFNVRMPSRAVRVSNKV